MPAIRSCNSFPKTPRRTRIQSTSVSDVTHPNTPESPTLRVEMSRALRRDPSMIFPQQTTLQYGLSFDQTIHDSGSHAGDTSSDAEWKSEVAEIADAPDRPLLYVAGDPVNIKVEENPGDLGIVPIGSLPESSEYFFRRMGCPFPSDVRNPVAEINPATVPTFQPLSVPSPQSETYLLLQLDCFSGAGLSEDRFLALIVRCHVCRRYMTSGTYEYHDCKGLSELSCKDIT